MSYHLLKGIETFTTLSTGEFLVIPNKNKVVLKVKHLHIDFSKLLFFFYIFPNVSHTLHNFSP